MWNPVRYIVTCVRSPSVEDTLVGDIVCILDQTPDGLAYMVYNYRTKKLCTLPVLSCEYKSY